MSESASTYDVTVRSAGLRRRRIVQWIFAVLATLSALAAVAMLGLVIGSVIVKGASSLSTEFFTSRAGSSVRRAGSRTRSSAASSSFRSRR